MTPNVAPLALRLFKIIIIQMSISIDLVAELALRFLSWSSVKLAQLPRELQEYNLSTISTLNGPNSTALLRIVIMVALARCG
jgi:hypothetical protein